MPIIKQILFPTDFSENAQQALPYALEIAHQTGASLAIVHSIEEPYDFAPMTQEFKKGVSRKVEILLQETVEDIRKQKKYSDLDITTQIQSGRALHAILEEAKNLKSDLIVMGARGRSGLEKLFVGSTTAEVVEHADIPVLAIPEEAGTPNFERLLFATDYQDQDLQALSYLAAFAQFFESDITVFHAAMKTDLQNEILFRGFRELVEETISGTDITFEQAPSDDFVDTITQKIKADTPSIVAMVRYDQAYSFFGKKYSKEMSFSPNRPLLILSGNEEFYEKMEPLNNSKTKKEQPAKQ